MTCKPRAVHSWSIVFALLLALLVPILAMASDVNTAVVDATAPTGSVDLAPGASNSITTKLTVTGKQEGTATFKVNKDWALSGGTFTGSNAETFTVAPRAALDPDTTFSASGTVAVAAGQAAGTFTLVVGALDITNTNKDGAKLSAGASSNYQVTVTAPADSTAPVLTLPANITAEATGPSGAVVSFIASASDLVDGARPVTCAPLSGSTFDLGTTTVNCSATDAHGNTATGSFTVTVQDKTPPSISDIPSNQTLEATSAAGAVATWNAPTASDLVDGARPVTCAPLSGSTFALGTATVNCSATDAHGNTATGSFTVTVQDKTPPSISDIPSNQTLEATSAAGAVATWTDPTASDLVDGPRPVTCAPASGSTFALGTTTVNCSATDAHSNTATGTFTVTVTYAWSNFLQPINLNDSSIFKLGSTVPVKFQLTGASAGIPNAVAKFWYVKVGNNVAGSETEAVSTAASTTGNLFRYDSTAGQYVFNWSTKGLTAGTYEIRADLGDGVSHTVRISLKP